ncbi:MAG: mas2 [Propionibacteriaceae bacterium]|jgi:NADPH:quinone reductase-like Zn-dependent oxidoreductase|nr:mas2 [Propionibacteriaceae bacterium]
MKAFALQEFDRAPEVTEVDLPTPGPGEVRVRVRAASLNGFDLSVANSYLKGMMEHRFPVVLGKDFAGEVDAVGPEIDGFQVGDRVFGVVMKDALGDGSFGEYVTVPVAFGIAKLPDGIDFTAAAALGLAGTAAVDAFDAADVTSGSTVLVIGATGGVGQQVLQLAVRAGATVIATAHSAEEVELVTRLGAAHTVDYRGDLVEQVRALHADGVDVVLHFAGDPAPLVAVVKPGGTLVSTMLRSADDVPADNVKVVSIYASPSTATLDRVARHEAEKHTTVTVQRVYNLEQTGEAIEQFAAGTLGKLVISID